MNRFFHHFGLTSLSNATDQRSYMVPFDAIWDCIDIGASINTMTAGTQFAGLCIGLKDAFPLWGFIEDETVITEVQMNVMSDGTNPIVAPIQRWIPVNLFIKSRTPIYIFRQVQGVATFTGSVVLGFTKA